MLRNTILALLASITSGTAYAIPLQLAEFSSVELRGRGEITLKHGPVQQVTVEEGATDVSTFSVDRNGRLIIQSCERDCGKNHKLRVVITRPSFAGLAVSRGGNMRADKGFAVHDKLALSVARGGSIYVPDISGKHVSANIRRGGVITTSASNALAAAITGGGLIRFRGNPQVTSSLAGPGRVRRD